LSIWREIFSRTGGPLKLIVMSVRLRTGIFEGVIGAFEAVGATENELGSSCLEALA
jgi:hypothetical protein